MPKTLSLISKILILCIALFLLTTSCTPTNEKKQESLSNEADSKTGALGKRLIKPKDIIYKGAFRLPPGSGGSNWEYSGYAMTYYPKGDSQGVSDGYPGSIFAVGHDHQQYVSEISVPKPVISKDLEKLNTAKTLQEFGDVTGGRYGELEIPRAGLEYLPTKNGGKLYFAWGQHFQFERKPAIGFSNINISSPKTKGLWYLGNFTNYVIGDYMFEIPSEWSASLGGARLATGRFRDGLWGGMGPALLAHKTPSSNNPPKDGSTIDVDPLLIYGEPVSGSERLRVSTRNKMKTFKEADEWSGGAWLTKKDKAAVILVGTKATGKSWYGFANGVEYPTSGDENEKVPEVPPWPYDDRGWWSDGVSAQIIFYDPSDLVSVAKGKKKTWDPQPYATLKIDKYLVQKGFDIQRQKRYLLGACSFDRDRGILYIFERRTDEEKSIVHVFKIV